MSETSLDFPGQTWFHIFHRVLPGTMCSHFYFESVSSKTFTTAGLTEAYFFFPFTLGEGMCVLTCTCMYGPLHIPVLGLALYNKPWKWRERRFSMPLSRDWQEGWMSTLMVSSARSDRGNTSACPVLYITATYSSYSQERYCLFSVVGESRMLETLEAVRSCCSRVTGGT